MYKHENSHDAIWANEGIVAKGYTGNLGYKVTAMIDSLNTHLLPYIATLCYKTRPDLDHPFYLSYRYVGERSPMLPSSS